MGEVVVLNREIGGWLRPYKLEESLSGRLSMNEAGRQLYRAVSEGRVRARRVAPDFVEVGEAGIAVDECYAASASCSTRWVTYLD
jgi:hypothetical protein